MTDRSFRRRSRALLAIAIALVVLGLLSVATYVVQVVGLDPTDESMAFWLLPFLLFGLATAGFGTVLAVLWLLLVNTGRRADADEAVDGQESDQE